jgi:sigma-B regulation protein RsbU (phosphoserine phosphatase)
MSFTPGIFTNSQGTWQERLELVTDTAKALSATEDPREMVSVFGERVGNAFPRDGSLTLSRRDLPEGKFRITRFSGWEDPIDPWVNLEKLPLLDSGILQEWLYSNDAQVIDDFECPESDPAFPYLNGKRSFMLLPGFDEGIAKNLTIMMGIEPNTFSVETLPEVVWTSNLFGRAVHHLRLGEALKEANRQIDHDMHVVSGIQLSLLPNGLPEIPHLDMAVYYQAAEKAGGDYYDFFDLGNGKWGILVADVSGHGPAAAVLMAITHSIAHTDLSYKDKPGEFLDHLNTRLILEYTGASKTFVTALYGVFDSNTLSFEYSCAGHDAPRIVRDGCCNMEIPDTTQNLPLGVKADERYGIAEVQLASNDVLTLFTDGMFEARNLTGENYGLERFQEILEQPAESPQHRLDAVLADLARFCDGAEQDDDQTMLVTWVK